MVLLGRLERAAREAKQVAAAKGTSALRRAAAVRSVN
jgi:hypothetical protein